MPTLNWSTNFVLVVLDSAEGDLYNLMRSEMLGSPKVPNLATLKDPYTLDVGPTLTNFLQGNIPATYPNSQNQGLYLFFPQIEQ